MNIIKFTYPGRDLFDRKHPIQIKFKYGNILFGIKKGLKLLNIPILKSIRSLKSGTIYFKKLNFN